MKNSGAEREKRGRRIEERKDVKEESKGGVCRKEYVGNLRKEGRECVRRKND